MRIRRSASSIFVLALIATSLLAHAQQQQEASAPLPDVLFIGSSSVNGALGRMIQAEVERLGLRVLRDGRSSTGLARPDFFDWHAQIPRFGNLRRLRGVIVYLGGNDAQALRLRDSEVPRGTPESRTWIQFRDERRWSDAYRRRTRELVDALCSAGARRVVVIPPVDSEGHPAHGPRIERVQRLQIEGTRASRCGVVADPSAIELSSELAGDGVHLNPAGARVVWSSIGPTILGALR